MPTSTRIKGRNLVLTLDGNDYAVDASSVVLTNEDADGEVRTFNDITPPKQWFFEIDGIQSTDTTSLWDFLWDSCGIPMELLWESYGIPMRILLDSCGIPVGFLCDSFGIPVGFL